MNHRLNNAGQRMNRWLQNHNGTDRYGLFLIGVSVVVELIGILSGRSIFCW